MTTTCEAIVSYAQGDYGFVPVTCSQSVGLVRIIDAAGVRHLACSRWSHAAEIIRRFGERVEAAEPDEPDWDMPESADPITAAKAEAMR